MTSNSFEWRVLVEFSVTHLLKEHPGQHLHFRLDFRHIQLFRRIAHSRIQHTPQQLRRWHFGPDFESLPML